MRQPALDAVCASCCALALIALPVALGNVNAAEQSSIGRKTPSLEGLKRPDQQRPVELALDASDEAVALHAVHIGLSEMPDGASFVWRRAHGRLSGVVQPKFSFKNAAGDICRQVTLTLKSGSYSRTVEGAACRQPDGAWSLEG